VGAGAGNKITAAILTVSTSGFSGGRKDESGKILEKLCAENGFSIAAKDIVSDDKAMIKKKLRFYSDKLKANVVLTTGGTGLGPFDITPEATAEVAERIVPGIPELIRRAGGKKTKRSFLSRGLCVIRKKTLIINLPGSPRGASESFEAVSELLPHAVDILKGGGHD